MITLVDSGKESHDLVLIGGGIGENRKPLKHCELFDPENGMSSEFPPMNFGVSSGTMVTFNKNIVFKLGGLGQFDSVSSSICEMVEKFDFGEYMKNGYEKWAYVEL